MAMYKSVLGKGRDMASDEYPPDEDVTVDSDVPMAGANWYTGPNPSAAGAGRGSVNPPASRPQRSAQVEKAIGAAGAGRGSVNPPASRPQRSAQVEKAIQEMQDAKDRKKISDMGYAKGGKVSSASKRADGIATKGKTRGKMC